MSVLVRLPPEDYDPRAFAQFLPMRGAFDLDDARAMMWMSQLAYETDMPSTIATVAPLWGFTSITPMRGLGTTVDTRVIIGLRPDCTVVAFAGTDPLVLRNVLTDAEFPLSPAGTHDGFQRAIDAVWNNAVKPAIQASPRPLFFAGHSLGAALAILAAKQAFDEGSAPAAVYGFGLPRVGGPEFATRYNQALGDRTFRLVHGNDIVPCVLDSIVNVVMPGGLAARLQFHHVGHMLRCVSGGKFTRSAHLAAMESDDPRFVPALMDDARARIGALLSGQLLAPVGPGELGALAAVLPPAIRDHLPDRYLNALAP